MSNNYDDLFKIIFLGNYGVGKTSIMHRYLYDKFQSYYSTIGYNFSVKFIDFNNKLIKMSIWDWGGTEHRIKKLYYSEANGAIVVYDITDRCSFDEVKSWVEEIKVYASKNIRIILVGNKCDLSKRKVTEEEGKKIANEIGAIFLEISAKTGHNIHETFNLLIKDIADNFEEPSIKFKKNEKNDKKDKCY